MLAQTDCEWREFHAPALPRALPAKSLAGCASAYDSPRARGKGHATEVVQSGRRLHHELRSNAPLLRVWRSRGGRCLDGTARRLRFEIQSATARLRIATAVTRRRAPHGIQFRV